MDQPVQMDHLAMKKGNLDRQTENENHQVRINFMNQSQSKSESACFNDNCYEAFVSEVEFNLL